MIPLNVSMNINIPQVNEGFRIGSFPITNTMIWTWIILGVLSVIFIWLGAGLKVKPESKKQIVAEMAYGAIENMINNTMGPGNQMFIPYFTALFAFLLACNLSGFWGLGAVRPPTADIVTPMALAIMTFILTQANNIRVNGIKSYLKSFIEPIPIMLPMNIIGEIANPVSLTFRMFGNLLGGLVIGTLIYAMLVGSNTVPIWVAAASVVLTAVLLSKQYKKIMALEKGKKKAVIALGVFCMLPLCMTMFVHAYFDIFSGCLQSYIFCMLSMIFISA